MKKLVKVLACVFAASMFFACDNGTSGGEPDIPSRDINDAGSEVTLITTPEEGENIPADSIRKYVKGAGTNWSVYNVYDLAKLAEIVNGGDPLTGVTITVQNDIVINEGLLTEDYDAPAEDGVGFANSKFNNLDSIGRFQGNNSKSEDDGGLGESEINRPFRGTFDGNGKVISGFYSYQGHQGLGFIGYTANGAVIKNVILKDACIVNYNIWSGLNDKGEESHDGYDDDRFGGLVGLVSGTTTIQNCFFSGVVGSKEALARGTPYEYIGGLIGRTDSNVTVNVTNAIVYARVYGSGDALVGLCKTPADYHAQNVTGESIAVFSEDIADEIEDDIEKVKGWIADSKIPYTVTITTPVNGTVAEVPAAAAGTVVTLTIEPADGYEVDTITVTGASGAVTVTDNKFTMPAEEVTVTVTFKPAVIPVTTFTVTFNADNNTPDTTKEVEENAKVEKPTDPVKDGYKFLGWFAPEAESAFDFENTAITDNLALTAHWEALPPATYTVTIEETANGGVTPVSDKAAGEEVALEITPDTDYEVESVSVETESGATVTVTGNTFVMPAENVTVTVTFKAKETQVDPPAGGTDDNEGGDTSGEVTGDN